VGDVGLETPRGGAYTELVGSPTGKPRVYSSCLRVRYGNPGLEARRDAMGRTNLNFRTIFCTFLAAVGFCSGGDERSSASPVKVFDSAGQRLPDLFEGLRPNPRLAADENLFKPAPAKHCDALVKPSPLSGQDIPWARFRAFLKRLLSIPVVYAIDCPWCYEPGNCTGQHFTCEARRCFDGCGGDYNRCFTSPAAPAWRGYCVSNEIVCPACPQCQERDCWNG
jgi:hypothetical protein